MILITAMILAVLVIMIYFECVMLFFAILIKIIDTNLPRPPNIKEKEKE